MGIEVPNVLRSGGPLRPLRLGLDLPSWFFHDLKAIDENFYFVWHDYRLLWDNIINQYEGEMEDPRFTISPKSGCGSKEVWGFILTDGKKNPIPENRWHLWRLCYPHGWAHIVAIKETSGEYLKFVVERLYFQAKITEKFGARGWSMYLREHEKLQSEQKAKDLRDKFNDVHKENRGLLRSALENLERNIIAPTNPQKETIMSYPGQTNRSRLSRTADDKEGGLYVPED